MSFGILGSFHPNAQLALYGVFVAVRLDGSGAVSPGGDGRAQRLPSCGHLALSQVHAASLADQCKRRRPAFSRTARNAKHDRSAEITQVAWGSMVHMVGEGVSERRASALKDSAVGAPTNLEEPAAPIAGRPLTIMASLRWLGMLMPSLPALLQSADIWGILAAHAGAQC